MIEPDLLFGRLGNRMWQGAFLYSYAKENNTDIYFQDPKFFDNYIDEIKELYGQGIGFVPHVGIHIRRGDYVNNPLYTDLSKTDYYEKAIKKFPDQNFLVFSDDTEFARSYFPDENKFQVWEGGDEIEDFNMLASCSSQIIANSSFSVWSGILNPNPSKKVIAPLESKYYTDGILRTKYPKDFTQLDFKYV